MSKDEAQIQAFSAACWFIRAARIAILEHLNDRSMIGLPNDSATVGSRKKKPADNFCIALHAAAEAEKAILGNEDKNIGDSQDQNNATDCLKMIGVRGAQFVDNDAWERYELNLRRRAKLLGCAASQQDRAASSTLMERKTLSAAEVDALLGVHPSVASRETTY